MSHSHESGWLRPKPCEQSEQGKTSIIFQQIDIDHYETFVENSSITSVIRLFGITTNGNSILCHVHGFHPYFYVYTCRRPDESRLEQFRHMLNEHFRMHIELEINSLSSQQAASTRSPPPPPPLSSPVTQVEYVHARSIYGYFGNDRQHYLKIVVANHRAMRQIGFLFEKKKNKLDSMGVYFPGAPGDGDRQIYEVDIDLEIRLMSDLGIHGCSWIELLPSKYKFRSQSEFKSYCQLECDVNYIDLIVHAPQGEWARVAPIRALSFDIETIITKGNNGSRSEFDAVIQISNVVITYNTKTPVIKCIFTLRSCAPIDGATIKSFDTEKEMLIAWSEFVINTDPDIITGYNIRNFDLHYLLNRASTLNVEKFPYIGRIRASKTTIREVSRRPLRGHNFDINIEGRIIFDMYQILRRDTTMGSYKLNAVASQILNDKKDDIHYSEIINLFNGDNHSRRKLAQYCLKDAELVIRLINKRNTLVFYMETARIVYMPLRFLLTRGPGLKVLSQILHHARGLNYLIPTIQIRDEEPFDVESRMSQPISGGYDIPFIIVAHNLCYTTLLSRATIDRYQLQPNDYIRTPSGDYFKKPDREHILVIPKILGSLLETIKQTKGEIAVETDSNKMTVLNGRRLAAIAVAASYYDFFVARKGKLPCIQIARSVVALEAQLHEKITRENKRLRNEQ